MRRQSILISPQAAAAAVSSTTVNRDGHLMIPHECSLPGTTASLLTIFFEEHLQNEDDRITSRDDAGNTVLHLACLKVAPSVFVQELISDHGNRVNCVNYFDSETPLHLCCAVKAYEHTRILLQSGADPRLKNGKGEVPDFSFLPLSDIPMKFRNLVQTSSATDNSSNIHNIDNNNDNSNSATSGGMITTQGIYKTERLHDPIPLFYGCKNDDRILLEAIAAAKFEAALPLQPQLPWSEGDFPPIVLSSSSCSSSSPKSSSPTSTSTSSSSSPTVWFAVIPRVSEKHLPLFLTAGMLRFENEFQFEGCSFALQGSTTIGEELMLATFSSVESSLQEHIIMVELLTIISDTNLPTIVRCFRLQKDEINTKLRLERETKILRQKQRWRKFLSINTTNNTNTNEIDQQQQQQENIGEDNQEEDNNDDAEQENDKNNNESSIDSFEETSEFGKFSPTFTKTNNNNITSPSLRNNNNNITNNKYNRRFSEYQDRQQKHQQFLQHLHQKQGMYHKRRKTLLATVLYQQSQQGEGQKNTSTKLRLSPEERGTHMIRTWLKQITYTQRFRDVILLLVRRLFQLRYFLQRCALRTKFARAIQFFVSKSFYRYAYQELSRFPPKSVLYHEMARVVRKRFMNAVEEEKFHSKAMLYQAITSAFRARQSIIMKTARETKAMIRRKINIAAATTTTTTNQNTNNTVIAAAATTSTTSATTNSFSRNIIVPLGKLKKNNSIKQQQQQQQGSSASLSAAAAAASAAASSSNLSDQLYNESNTELAVEALLPQLLEKKDQLPWHLTLEEIIEHCCMQLDKSDLTPILSIVTARDGLLPRSLLYHLKQQEDAADTFEEMARNKLQRSLVDMCQSFRQGRTHYLEECVLKHSGNTSEIEKKTRETNISPFRNQSPSRRR